MGLDFYIWLETNLDYSSIALCEVVQGNKNTSLPWHKELPTKVDTIEQLILAM